MRLGCLFFGGIMKLTKYFSRFELALWGSSLLLITLFYLIFDRSGMLTLIASLIGATSLIFCAKGNPFGQLLMVIFSVIYAIISLSFAYYGEMLTYLGMTCPMAVFALISWLKNPYNGNKSEVRVNRIGRKEVIFMLILSAAMTLIFYFILKFFNTANLLPSALSVATSFIAVYLSFRRSPYFALAYAANDVVLIILWVIASFHDPSYVSVVVCFVTFLINDLYGFISWRRMEKRQKS